MELLLQNALMLLRTSTRAVVLKGWSFNTNLKETLTRAIDGTITPAAPRVRVRPRLDQPSMFLVNAVMRQGKLYDRTNNTFVWTQDLVVDSTLLFAFADLPETMRQYITILAGRKFQTRFNGSEKLKQLTEEDELQAYATLIEEEGEDANANYLNDSEDVAGAWAYR